MGMSFVMSVQCSCRDLANARNFLMQERAEFDQRRYPNLVCNFRTVMDNQSRGDAVTFFDSFEKLR